MYKAPFAGDAKCSVADHQLMLAQHFRKKGCSKEKELLQAQFIVMCLFHDVYFCENKDEHGALIADLLREFLPEQIHFKADGEAKTPEEKIRQEFCMYDENLVHK